MGTWKLKVIAWFQNLQITQRQEEISKGLGNSRGFSNIAGGFIKFEEVGGQLRDGFKW